MDVQFTQNQIYRSVELKKNSEVETWRFVVRNKKFHFL